MHFKKSLTSFLLPFFPISACLLLVTACLGAPPPEIEIEIEDPDEETSIVPAEELPVLYESDRMTIRGECTAACAEGRAQCRRELEEEAAACSAECFENPYDTYCDCCYCTSGMRELLAACDHQCAQPDACGASTFQTRLTGFDEEVSRTCLAWGAASGCLDHEGTYTTYNEVDYCGLYAMTERPEAAAIYECLSGNPGCEPGDCAPLPDVDRAGQICSNLDQCDQGCTDEQWTFLANSVRWFHADVLGGLDACLSLSCGEGKVHCFRSWVRATSHHSVTPARY